MTRDPAVEIRRLFERIDELIKYASNRPEPATAYRTARIVLDQAADHLDDIADHEVRDDLVVQLGRRADDLNVLLRDEDRTVGASEPGPARRPDHLPQPTPQTVHPVRPTGGDRVPPNQRLVTSWPVLHTGRAPRIDLASWTFTCTGLVDGHRVRWTWEEFQQLPTVASTSDFHCVTGWSRLDNRWEGVRFRDVADAAGVDPAATHALILGANAYSANCDLPSPTADDVLFAWSHDGAPLTAEHGGPLRLVRPSRYAWKSVKWVTGVQFLDHDVAGYWEARGYHNVADPFLEQRYS
ncbi:MAG: sulfite oxidase-like oxidoreductase [Actinobacteria bacterium]|nr:sulfite oxidase-like oxidoreductase [Actinomycetota bacterium]